MTIEQQLHRSKAHRSGFAPNCPQCLEEYGIFGIIAHLRECARQNEKDACDDAGAKAVAAEQRRMIGILEMYRKVPR